MDAVKAQITAYWARRAARFSDQRMREYYSDKHRLWLEELRRLLPAGAAEILDIGTGSGFFAMLLSAEGLRVTGIDLCAGMIAEAEDTAGRLGLPARFLVMDAERPDLPEGGFDAIVTRNLTWTLPHLPEAYRAWRRLLRPGGVLVNFDADYCREEARPLPENHAHKDIAPALLAEYEAIKDRLRPAQQSRPEWDEALLREAGFHNVQVDRTVWKRLYGSVDEFYNPTPVFAITATA